MLQKLVTDRFVDDADYIIDVTELADRQTARVEELVRVVVRPSPKRILAYQITCWVNKT